MTGGVKMVRSEFINNIEKEFGCVKRYEWNDYSVYKMDNNNGWIYYILESNSSKYNYPYSVIISEENSEKFFYIMFIDENQKKSVEIQTWCNSLNSAIKHCFWIASNFMKLDKNNLEVYVKYDYFFEKDRQNAIEIGEQMSYYLSKEDIKQYIESLKSKEI